ncbi:hypothetical protein [Streptomyces sp. NBC_01236]|uniref:hypothetical protein n=1 Tax=Streptomyces sp. NBC_01236 TaxID=2903789 RepID=UPI002E12DD29|nr:hypothetical protein OG324_26850 [Streptomyces sp. NBC_01236]
MTEPKRTTAYEYGRDIALYPVPVGVLKMHDLRARHAQGISGCIVSSNPRRLEHSALVAELQDAPPQFFSERWDRLVELNGLPPIRLHDGPDEAESPGAAPGRRTESRAGEARALVDADDDPHVPDDAARAARREGFSLLRPHHHIPGSKEEKA